jgi:hypothetical protein
VGVSGTATSGGLWILGKSGRAASQLANVAIYALERNTTPTAQPAYRTAAAHPVASSDGRTSWTSQPLWRRTMSWFRVLPLVSPVSVSLRRASDVGIS